MKKISFFLLVIFFLASCRTSQKLSSKNIPIRGTWLTNVVSDALDSPEKLKEAVKYCHDLGLNTVFVVVWNRGRTLYPSQTMKNLIGIEVDQKYGGRDILKETIEAAKPYNMKVVAWFEFGFSCDLEEKEGVVEGYEILKAKPNWAAIDNNGQVVKKNGFRWLNGFNPEVQEFMLSLLMECVQKYPDLDGIQGDDRLPALPSESGYDDYTKKLYAQENKGAEVPKDTKNPQWLTWRANKMNDFMEKIYKTAKKINPSILVSMSPSIYPWSKEEYLQDWVTWVEKGWVDMVCPQVYRFEVERYENELVLIKKQVSAKNLHKISPAILLKTGDYTISNQNLEAMIQANRKHGFGGEIYFYYEGMKPFTDLLKKTYQK